ncbi:ATP-dependent DNA helicase RecQ [Lentibacillus halophilus]|uniref:ATP-dependent DNA helicase RecQ n=1 Tax=Lentibacillus halophilus TaxID=295065 RepID=A0ABN0ZDW0_9BACI
MDIHKLKQQLWKYFKISSFRPGQSEIIRDSLAGNDVLGVLPTGSGKSLCYQLPATLLGGVTIVVSPLISLMEDQVKQLKAVGFKSVVSLNSFMNPVEKKHVLQGLDQYQLIYLSPELLQQRSIIQWLQEMTVKLFVIDEAHCISQWGHEFRPDYLRLADVLNLLNHPPVMALSGTATPEVQDDIATSLNRQEIKKHIYPMDRDNITFSVKKVTGEQEKQDIIVSLLKRFRVPALIYFSSKRKTEEVAAFLSEHMSSHRIAFYHGDMDQMDRITIQQQFMNDQIDVICCTSAFGMGINKQNIRMVVHYHFPMQMASYIQEIGRAGRDGKSSISLLLYSPSDQAIPHSIIENELPKADDLPHIGRQLRQWEQLPTTEELLQTLGLNEIQWRFLHYQMEWHGLIKNNQMIYDQGYWDRALQHIGKLIGNRLEWKHEKLQEMLRWIQERHCLRRELYKGFQDSYKPPVYACCSNCDFSFKHWSPVQTSQYRPSLTWETKLKHIFFAEESYAKTERTN